MDVVGIAENTTATPNTPWIPFFAGLIAAGAAASIICQLPSPHSLSWSDVFLLATAYGVAIVLSNVVTAWAVNAILPDESSFRPLKFMLLGSFTAAWFPLLVLLFREDSPWAILVTIAATATLTRTVLALRTSGEAVQTEFLPDPPEYKFLQVPDSSPLIRLLFPMLCIAACSELGVLALLRNHLFTAAALFTFGSSVCTSQLSAQSLQKRTMEMENVASPIRTWPILLLAILLTAVVLIPFVSNRRLAMNMRPYLSGQAFFRVFILSGHRVQVEKPARSYFSVILWPVQKKHKNMVVPSPVSSSFIIGPHSSIVKIPFDGVYWYFKLPDRRPEPNAHVVHGSPIKIDVRSTDWQPIIMQARQSLGNLVNLDCCSQIRVAIKNADNRPGIISLGVILTNTTLPGDPTISLGDQRVASSHPVMFSIDRPPVSEVLTFRIPAGAKIRQFNEITVVFRPAPERALGGAKIAIREFMLVPKGT